MERYRWCCMGCGQPTCYHNQSYCVECTGRTSRVVIVSKEDYLGAPRLAEFLEPGESVFSTIYDPLKEEYHITIRKEVV